jgi:hypothetical protein
VFGLPVLIAAAWQSQTGRIVLFVIGGLIALDLAAGVKSRLARSRPLTPREYELRLASRGAGLLALCALACWNMGGGGVEAFLTGLRAAPFDWRYLAPASIFGTAAALGLVWLCTGWHRSWGAGFRDGRILAKATGKLALAAVIYWAFWYPPASWPREVVMWLGFARIFPYSAPVLAGLLVWLAVTASARIVLVALPWGGDALHTIRRQLKQRNAPLVAARGGNGWRGRLLFLAALAMLGGGAACFLW